MSSPFNLSLCFTIVLTRISSVFEELISQGQPSWIPSRGHPVSYTYAHICEILDIYHPRIPYLPVKHDTGHVYNVNQSDQLK